MPTYKIGKPSGNERYNVTIPKITKKLPFDKSGIPPEMHKVYPNERDVELGSIELKNIASDVANAIIMLCEAANISMTIELVETPNTASS